MPDSPPALPRPEYPRPQWRREPWLCLNGEWQFAYDPSDLGLRENWQTRAELPARILVPFCPESPLSGHGDGGFHPVVWYRRKVTVPADWRAPRLRLHFQAVDYKATVWVNGLQIARHHGGFTPFHGDLPADIRPGDTFTLVVRAQDNPQELKPRGKQFADLVFEGVFYARTTGIWQTVWLEPLPHAFLERARVTPAFARGEFEVEAPVRHAPPGALVLAVLRDAAGEVARDEAPVGVDFDSRLRLPIPEPLRRAWCPEDPHLYDLDFALLDADGRVLDRVASYAGLRSVALADGRFLLNGAPRFLRLVLDQGHYPDGILTAPDDEALVRDIRLARSAGFDGARLHQKVFEERFLHHRRRHLRQNLQLHRLFRLRPQCRLRSQPLGHVWRCRRRLRQGQLCHPQQRI